MWCSFVKSVPEYAYQSATVCLVSTTAIFRLPFAVNVMLYLLVIVSVYHFQKRHCLSRVTTKCINKPNKNPQFKN